MFITVLVHLASKEGTEKLFVTLAPKLMIDKCLQETVHFLLQGGIVFSQDFWSWLGEYKPDIYATCQPDV